MSIRDLLLARAPRQEWELIAEEIIDSGIGTRRCFSCDVTWRGLKGSACWCCGRPSC